jgi:hypothetical protein
VTRIDWSRVAHLLGTVPDSEIAALVGTSLEAVAQARWRLGILAWQTHRRDPLSPAEETMLADLSLSDREIAARTGRSRSAIGRRRRLLGLR